MYFTEYEISLMPEGDQQVMYYEPDSNTQHWSNNKNHLSTVRPGRRGQLGEGEGGLEGGEMKRQMDQHQKQRHHGLLSSGSNYKGDSPSYGTSQNMYNYYSGVVFPIMWIVGFSIVDLLI